MTRYFYFFLFFFLLFIEIRPENENYYSILGVPRTASRKQIKKAFFSLSQKYHPDKSIKNNKKYEKIIEAYETLKDTEKKREYDEELEFGAKFRTTGFSRGRRNFGFYEQEYFYKPHERGERFNFEKNYFDFSEMTKTLHGMWKILEILFVVLMIPGLGIISIFTMKIYYFLKINKLS